ncbi:MAG: hypothetical protein HQM08_02715 [Candidatus Riflebacteria bacterium]|nr:hypothetical protein [Candidatus Riflebacteria bacterium]
MKRPFFRIFPTLSIILFCFLFLAMINSLHAENQVLGNTQLKLLISWDLNDPEEIILKAKDKDWKFFPQSFAEKDGLIWFVNRYEPLLVKYPLKGPFQPDFIPLQHSKDKKFSARFFIDLLFDKKDIFCLEQSTASLRKTDETGVINDMFLITEAQGAIISHTWKSGDNEFGFFDEGLHKVYFRKFGPKTNDAPDKAGSELMIEEPKIIPGSKGILCIRNPQENCTQVIFQPKIDNGGTIKAANYESAEVIPLDVGEKDCFYLYVSKADSAFISVLKMNDSGKGFSEKRYSVEKMLFPKKAAQICRVLKADKLLLLTTTGKKISLQGCTLTEK